MSPKLELEGKLLKVVNEYRLLRVTIIDSKLSFSSHVKNVIARKRIERVQNRALQIIARMSKDTPGEILQLQARVEPLNS